MSTWTSEYIDSLVGKYFVITDATSGVGLETTKQLMDHGATVIMGGANEALGEKVAQELQAVYPHGRCSFRHLDLSFQSTIFAFARGLLHETPFIDVLINNASVAGPEKRAETIDGHELVFSVNYLGHFILTSQLFPLLLRSRDPRIVNLCGLHRKGEINLKDLDLHDKYGAQKAYAQSKLAMLMFSLELHRRCRRAGIKLRSIPAHVGILGLSPWRFIQKLLMEGLKQGPGKGALPLLFAATSVEARSGIYYGPDGLKELWGNPTEARVSVQAENMLVSRRLWEETERLSVVRFDIDNKAIGVSSYL